MGASRDFTSTAVLDRGQQAGKSTRAPEKPRTPQTPLPGRRRRPVPAPTRLGSRQVVSVRGRRTVAIRRSTLLMKLVGISVVLAIAGVAVAMWLSGVSTQLTFRMQTLSAQDQQLSNQLETLNRDLENVRSSAELARRSGELGLEVPVQPGILAVGADGVIVEERPADVTTRPLIDVNGAPVRPGQASSDPDAIRELGDNLEALPQAERLRAPEESAGAPYGQGVAPYERNVAPYAPNIPAEDQ